MASTDVQPNRASSPQALPGRRHDHLFFSLMALLLLATVFIGFAPTYYLAGTLHAALPSRTIHVHAVVFTVWMLLFAAQVSLVSVHRVDLHRRLGMIGFLLACAMVITGLLAAADALVRNVASGLGDTLFMVNVSMAVMFAVLMAFAYRMRSNPAAHKRLILIADIALMFAPLIRLPIASLYHNIPFATRSSYLFLLPIMLYDLWSTRRIQRVTLWSSAFVVSVFEVRFLVAKTMAWHALAVWIRSKAA